jgi:hypothetical protein
VIEHEFAELVPQTLEREPAKVIALKIGTTPKAARNWKERENKPTVPHFIMLARQYPEIGAAVRRWLDMEQNHDPEAAQLLNMVAVYLQRRAK